MEIIYIFARFAVAFALSFALGFERQISNKPIGFGAFVFVAVGSCAIGITSSLIIIENPLFLFGAVITGIGFLGAGALIRSNEKIFGFTTAASIWAMAIFGLIIGIGEYLVGLTIYAIIQFVVIVDKTMEKKGIGSYQRKIIINTNQMVDKHEILMVFGRKKWKLVNLNVDKKKKKISATYLFNGSREDISKINDILYGKKWVESFKIE